MTQQARAPGKIIVSGEHAVVYGRPAIAMAVDLHAVATVGPAADGRLTFEIPALPATLACTPAELVALRDERLAGYAQFLAGRLPIAAVLPRAVELIPLAFSLVPGAVESRAGLHLRLDVQLPVGAGMGSSAAVALSVLKAADAWLAAGLDDAGLFDRGMQCERLMHGHPSGVDVHVSLHGGAVRFQAGQVQPRPPPAWPFVLLHTGKPACSTGECVMAVRGRFATSHIWDDFAAVTDAIDATLAQPVAPAVPELIHRNHRLLCEIGVVPQRVRRLIADIEAADGAAKICGAGAVRGDTGGVVLAVGVKDLEGLCREHGARRLDCAVTHRGVHLVPAAERLP